MSSLPETESFPVPGAGASMIVNNSAAATVDLHTLGPSMMRRETRPRRTATAASPAWPLLNLQRRTTAGLVPLLGRVRRRGDGAAAGADGVPPAERPPPAETAAPFLRGWSATPVVPLSLSAGKATFLRSSHGQDGCLRRWMMAVTRDDRVHAHVGEQSGPFSTHFPATLAVAILPDAIE